MFTALVVALSFTYGYICCVWHANFLDKRTKAKRDMARVNEAIGATTPETILNYDYV